jgi:hypothetical protein
MTLFAITNYTDPYAEWFVSYWLWRRVMPYTQFRLWAREGCGQSAEDAYSSVAPDPTIAFVGGPYCSKLDFVFAFWIDDYV